MGETKDILDQAAESLRDHFEWQDATYTPAVGSPVSCAVYLAQETAGDPDGFTASSWMQRKTVTALLADIGQEPDAGDTFFIDSTTYTVTSDEPENSGRFVKVFVK